MATAGARSIEVGVPGAVQESVGTLVLGGRGGAPDDGSTGFAAGNRRAFFARFVRYVDREMKGGDTLLN